MKKYFILILLLFMVLPYFLQAQDIEVPTFNYLSKETIYKELKRLNFEIAGKAALGLLGVAFAGFGGVILYELSNSDFEIDLDNIGGFMYLIFAASGVYLGVTAIAVGIPAAIIGFTLTHHAVKSKKQLQFYVSEFKSLSYHHSQGIGVGVSIPLYQH